MVSKRRHSSSDSDTGSDSDSSMSDGSVSVIEGSDNDEGSESDSSVDIMEDSDSDSEEEEKASDNSDEGDSSGSEQESGENDDHSSSSDSEDSSDEDSEDDGDDDDDDDDDLEVPDGCHVSSNPPLFRIDEIQRKQLWIFRVPKDIDTSILENVKVPVDKLQDSVPVKASKKDKRSGKDKSYLLKETSPEEFNAHFIPLIKSDTSNRVVVAKPFSRALKLQSQYVENAAADESHTEVEMERWKERNNPVKNGMIPGWPKKEIKMRRAFIPFGAIPSDKVEEKVAGKKRSARPDKDDEASAKKDKKKKKARRSKEESDSRSPVKKKKKNKEKKSKDRSKRKSK